VALRERREHLTRVELMAGVVEHLTRVELMAGVVEHLARSELMAGVVEHLARAGVTSAAVVRQAARRALSTVAVPSVDVERVLAAVRSLGELERRWAEPGDGEELCVRWPEQRTRRRRPPR